MRKSNTNKKKGDTKHTEKFQRKKKEYNKNGIGDNVM